MEIKDPQAFYKFLGDLSWFANIAFFVLAALIVSFITINISEKIFDSKSYTLKRNTVIVIIVLVLTCGIVLKREANETKKQFKYANEIKSYMLEFRKRYKSLKNLANGIELDPGDSLCNGDEECLQKRIKLIKNNVEYYPDQFILCRVYDSWYGESENNVEGLELIDDKAIAVIDSFEMKMIPFYQGKILNYMNERKIDTMTYSDILKLDGRCSQAIVDMVISNSSLQMIPINYKNESALILRRETKKKIE